MAKREINIDEVIELILSGKSTHFIASHYNIPYSSFYAFLLNPDHSARVRDAKLAAASTYADMAEKVLSEAPKDPIEMTRARELASHYRWKASKFAPKVFGDKVNHEHSGTDGDPIKILKLIEVQKSGD
jgi:hypothetical protein